MPYSTLERQLATALRQAASENRFDVAEHIIRALEVLGSPTRACEARTPTGGVNVTRSNYGGRTMRIKLALGSLAVAAGFMAMPVLAQTTGQPSSPMPGMSTTAPSQPGQQSQGSGGCSCCKNMAMMQAPAAPSAPKPQ